MEINRNKSGSYSVFVPLQFERAGKYGFRVQFVGYVLDDGFDVVLDGMADENRQLGGNAAASKLAKVPQ